MADLAECYARTRQLHRLILLGRIMSVTMGQTAQFQRALPYLLAGCKESDQTVAGVEIVDLAYEQAEDVNVRIALRTAKARFLVDLQKFQDAQEVLDELAESAPEQVASEPMQVLKARVLIGTGYAKEGMDLCRLVALDKKVARATRAEALRVMGEHYESQGQFQHALRACSGQCLIPTEETAP